MTSRPRSFALVLLALSAACTEKAAETAAPRKGQDRVLIGATLPLTGGEAKSGAMFQQGYELAVEEVNRRGGLDLRGGKARVELIVHDDQTNAASVTALTAKLVEEEKVDFLLGSYTSALVKAGSDVAEQARVPYVNGAGGLVDLYKRNYRYLFGVQPPIEQIPTSLMLWLESAQRSGRLPRPARIAFLWENNGYGKSFRKGLAEFRERPEQASAWDLVVDEPFELGAKDFSAQLAKVKAAHADVFLATIHMAEYLQLHQQYLKAGLCHKVESYGTRGLERQYGDLLGAHGTDGLMVVSFWNEHVGNKALLKTFLDGYRARYGAAPDWYQAIAYETARVLLSAIEHAGSVDRERVRDALATGRFPSIVPGGQLSFPAEYGQQARFLFVVQQNQPDGSAAIVYPAIAATTSGDVPSPRCGKDARAAR